MRFSNFPPKLLCILFSLFILLEIKGQEVIDINTAASPTITIDVANLDPLGPGAGFTPPPFYNIFWILGDGNYNWKESVRLRPSVSYGDIGGYRHTYLAPVLGEQYRIAALLIDRKSDDKPPSLISGNTYPNPPGGIANDMISITGAGLTPPDYDYIRNTNTLVDLSAGSCTKVGLRGSHFLNLGGVECHYMEDSSQMAFVLPFYPELENGAGRLFFFYQNDGGSLFESYDPVTDAYRSNYGGQELNGSINSEPAVNYHSGGPGTGLLFDDVIIYDFIDTDLSIDNFSDGKEELRLFHILTSIETTDGVPFYPFMVMMGSQEPPSCGQVNYDPNQGNDEAIVSEYVEFVGNDLKIRNTDLFFVDADTIQLKAGEPKDPNELEVTKICRCCEDCDDYNVSFLLKYCNESATPSTSASIFINDLSGHFECFRSTPAKHNLRGGTEYNWKAAPCEACSISNFYTGSDARFCAGGYSLILNSSTVEDENCVFFAFTAQTNEDGLNALLTEGALEACVNFHDITEGCDKVCSKSKALKQECNPLARTIEVHQDYKKVVDVNYKKECEIWDNRNTVCDPPCNCISNFWQSKIFIIGAIIVIFFIILWRFTNVFNKNEA